MQFIDPKLVINEEQAAKVLEKTLILCPTYDRPIPQTEILIDTLIRYGAVYQPSRGISDVALHRCMLARTVRMILEDHQSRFESVFTLDGDMGASAYDVALLCHWAHVSDACISGLYAKKLEGGLEWTCRDVDALPITLNGHELRPISGGLGCMAIGSHAFLHLCREAENIVIDGREMPCMYQSRLVELNGQREWQSEDMYFCAHAWQSGVGVYLAPISFCHFTTAPIWPSESGKFMPGKSLIAPHESPAIP